MPESYKGNPDMRVCLDPLFAIGDLIFIERSALSADLAENIAMWRYTKLPPLQLGPYRFISVGIRLINCLQHEIANTASLNRLTGDPRVNEGENNGIADKNVIGN